MGPGQGKRPVRATRSANIEPSEQNDPRFSELRTYHELDEGPSHLPHLVHATTLPGRSNYPTSAASRHDTHSTAVQAPESATAVRSTHHVASTLKSISRKPIERSATTATYSTISTDLLTRSNTLSSATNTLLPVPSSSNTRDLTTTNMLLNQASRSLTSLTHGQHHTESPPPYVDAAPTTIVASEKSEEPSEAGDIFELVRENRLDSLQKVLELGSAVNEVDGSTKRTPIMEAANLRRLGAARILVRSGCRLHLKDGSGWSALHFAAAQGDAEMCQLFLDAGAQLDEYSNDGDTPLLLAARGGHPDVLLVLLNCWTTQMSSGITFLNAFLEATKSGNVRAAELFVERGINPRKIQDSWRPVIFAAQSGSIPMIDFLLVHKCNLKLRDPEGRNALHFAAILGHTAMVEKLLAWKLSWNTQTRKNQETPLHYATLAKQSSAAMALILHKNANITSRDAQGIQALHHCVRNGDIVLTTALLNKGAKIDEQTRYGWTPMLLACAYGRQPIIAEFITRGVNLEEKLASPSFKPKEMTNEAARRGYWAEIRWPHPGARPLHLALEFGHDEVVRDLVAAGAKIEEGDSEGWKPLHYAAFNCRAHMVHFLLNRGASPHSTTATGNTPLTLGFREAGLTATYDEKLQVCDMLQAAQYAQKKSKFRKLSDAMSLSSNKSREVGERNRVWHTAQLADTLFQMGEPGYDGAEDEGKSFSQRNSMENDDDDSGYGEPRTTEIPLRITKTRTD